MITLDILCENSTSFRVRHQRERERERVTPDVALRFVYLAKRTLSHREKGIFMYWGIW